MQETVDIAIAHISNYNPELAEKLKSQVEAIAGATPEAEPDDLSSIVSRVVDYLLDSQQNVNGLDLCSHHDALDNNLISNELQAFLRLGQLLDLAELTSLANQAPAASGTTPPRCTAIG